MPFAVEIAASDVDGGEIIVGDDDAFWVARLVKTTTYGEAGIGARCGDEFDDDLVGGEGLPAPVPGDKREETVLDPVPPGHNRRQMAGDQGHAVLAREPVQRGIPQRAAGAIAATPVRD